MLHPHTEMKYVSAEIGYGIFATQDIPKGTIVWVKDELDRTFTPDEVSQLSGPNLENLLKYTYRDKNGNYFFSWDLTRYVNHSYEPNSMLTSMGFEIAIVDIKKDEEITNDYGTLNIIEAFKCANGPHEREHVRPDDLVRFYAKWDELVNSAMDFQAKVEQPLSKFLTNQQKTSLDAIHMKKIPVPSILENYFEDTVAVYK
jgi:uncharacterized protein